jgi:acetylornithine deacetylase/succinyl-diaminopimelate desuccinylase-like protein
MPITRRHRNERIAAAILVLVLLAVVIAFIRWNKAEEEALRRDTRYIPKRETITPEILLLRDYIRIDTTTTEGVARGARWLADLLARNGLRPEIIESTPGRLNVYARIRGKKRGGGLLLTNHIDVVPAAPAEWSHPPFAGEIHLNQLWGRGALDMKSIALSEIFAMAAVQRSGDVPEHDIAFLATAEEELGSDNGLKWLLAHRPDLFDGIAYAVSEGGITEVLTERVSYFGIEVGSKQLVQVILRGPKEKLLEARMALEPYMASRERARVLPEVRRFFTDVAPARLAMKPYLTDIDRTIAEGKLWNLAPSYRELLQNTMQVTEPWKEETQWGMSVMMLNLPDEKPEERIAWIERFLEPYGLSLQVWKKEGPVPSSTTGTRLFTILAEEAREFYGVAAGSEVLYASSTDCRFLRSRGIACYGVSPALTDVAQSTSIHKANERIRLDWFMNGIDYLTRVVRTWAGEG